MKFTLMLKDLVNFKYKKNKACYLKKYCTCVYKALKKFSKYTYLYIFVVRKLVVYLHFFFFFNYKQQAADFNN